MRSEHDASRWNPHVFLANRPSLTLSLKLCTATMATSLTAISPLLGQGYTSYTLRTVDLTTVEGDREPLALDVIDELVAPVGSSCPEGTRCVIRGFFSNSGSGFSAPGRFRHFEMLAPVPVAPNALGLSVANHIANFSSNFAKKPGRQGVTVNSTLAFCSIGERWTSNMMAPVQPERVVSVVDSMTASFDPASGDKPTNVLTGQSGTMPQGGIAFTTYVDGRHSRFYAVANFRDGTVSIYDWTNASSVNLVKEIEVDHHFNACAGSGAAYGDLSRAITAMTPTAGAHAGKLVLIVALNFDPITGACENLDWDDSGPPDCSVDPEEFDYPGTFPDEAITDAIVVQDVSGLSSMNASTFTLPAPRYYTIQSAKFGTVTAITPHPDGDALYVVSYDNPGFNSCDEDPWLIAANLTTMTLSTVSVVPIQINLSAFGGAPEDFNPTQGHCPLIRNPNLSGPTDRLYIPAFNASNGPGRIMIVDVTGATDSKFAPVGMGVIEDVAFSSIRVQDLSAIPVKESFLGSNMNRNVLFGVASHPSDPSVGAKLFVLEDT